MHLRIEGSANAISTAEVLQELIALWGIVLERRTFSWVHILLRRSSLSIRLA
jgi:hypothetical protein